MNILDIKNPDFLKKLSIKELNNLANDIRLFLIDSVSKTGGHLSSNLGVVELTIALHYVFNAPKDKILFDVGHQSYIHKILTGRANKMSGLRSFGGISGFQKRNESIYDCFEAGHSSTSLSTALGMCIARDLRNEEYNIIPVIGDASLMSGLSLEALNEIGYENRKMIIIFNDNNMSINKNVGALSKSFASLRSSNTYTGLKENLKDKLVEQKYGKKIIKDIHNIKKSIKDSIIDSGIFKEYNIDYLGPIDGHNIEALIKAFNTAKNSEGPIVVHVITKKGKGYKYAENDPNGKWHGVSKFDKESGKTLCSTPIGYISYSKLVADSILKIMDHNNDVVTITPAMITGSCLNDIFAKYPKRSFDCGIAEDHAVCTASGLALNDYHPFVSIYSSFLQRAYDQMNHDICRMDLAVTFGVDRSGLVGEDGATHHGVFDISMMNHLPNIIISEGKDASEISNLLYTSFKQKHPFIVRYPRGYIKEENSRFERIPIGTWTKLNEVKKPKAIIISYGNDLNNILNIVNVNKLKYLIINARFIKPLDETMLKELANYKCTIYVYTEEILSGGLGDSILSFYNRNNIQVKLKAIGIDDLYVKHGPIAKLKEDLGINIESLFKIIKKDLNA